MMRLTLHLALFTLLAASTACGQSPPNWLLRPTPIEALPDRLVPDTARGAPSEFPGISCISPLLDPATGTQFTLHQSILLDHGPIGDYTVQPPGSYDLSDTQVVRVDCAIGRPLGAVPRS